MERQIIKQQSVLFRNTRCFCGYIEYVPILIEVILNSEY